MKQAIRLLYCYYFDDFDVSIYVEEELTYSYEVLAESNDPNNDYWLDLNTIYRAITQ